MKKGFTLIELLVVVAIVAILAIVAVLTINPVGAPPPRARRRRVIRYGNAQ